jgi:hypothetical protein
MILKVFPKSFSWIVLEKISRNYINEKGKLDEISLIKNDKPGLGTGIQKYAFNTMMEEFHLIPDPVSKFTIIRTHIYH